MKLAGAYINEDKYEVIEGIARSNNRTLAGQCRHWFDEGIARHQGPLPPAPEIVKLLASKAAKGRAK